MTIRLEMLQVARLAPRQLGDGAAVVGEFLRETFGERGGGGDRAGSDDLYYSVFALEGLDALQLDRPIDRAREYLASFEDGAALDLVHLACLVRCHASLGLPTSEPVRAGMLRRLAERRATDGGFSGTVGAARGTLYHAFLALSAYQDLAEALPAPERLAASVLSLRCEDGSFTNDTLVPVGNVPSTAAALTVLRHLGAERPDGADAWILDRRHPNGGFHAIPGAPIPDLLSTATALHALAGPDTDAATYDALREPCLDFLDTLWTGRAFCGSWADETADSEYTWYALLALGHLAL